MESIYIEIGQGMTQIATDNSGATGRRIAVIALLLLQSVVEGELRVNVPRSR